jgi:hypothetical protein
MTGPTGPTGSGTGSGVSISECFVLGGITQCVLKNKAMETGVWSVSISLPSGAPQQQVDGVASFNPPYPTAPATLKVKYKNEKESGETTVPPCLGSTNEPTAEPGNFCAYRGAGVVVESKDKNAKFVTFEDGNGEEFTSGSTLPNEVFTGNLGLRIAFRTTQFSTTPTTVTEATELNAGGGWALTAN